MVARQSLLTAANGAAVAGSLGCVCVCERERERRRGKENRASPLGATHANVVPRRSTLAPVHEPRTDATHSGQILKISFGRVYFSKK
jgi:hypothetical protein